MPESGVPGSAFQIRQARLDDLETVVPLFDGYRVFYRREGDVELARSFLRERLKRDESVILLAYDGGVAVGFTQLYPSFSSASAARIYILNDLFVAPGARRQGVAKALLAAATKFAKNEGAIAMRLSTETLNTSAQALYTANGWQRDEMFWHYNLSL